MATILSCTEGSLYAPSIYELTAWAAGRLEAGVEVLNVVEPLPAFAPSMDFAGGAGISVTPVFTPELASIEMEPAEQALKHSGEILEDARTRLQAAGVAHSVLTSLDGTLIDVIKHWEKPFDLLVIGKRGEETDTETGEVGAHLQSIIRASRSPVLVATRTFRTPHRFLLSFDDTPASHSVLGFAATTPLLKGLSCCLLMAGDPTPENSAALETARHRLEDAGFKVETLIHEGDPEAVSAWEIAAHNIDLLVMGAYSHSRFLQFFTGSTTTEMIRHSRVPILLLGQHSAAGSN